MIYIFLGILLSFLAAGAAYYKQSLNLSGFIGAFLLGSLIYYWGGFFFWLIMITFFISSSLLTKYKAARKDEVEALNEKGGRRDYIQVLANGGLGLIFAFLYYTYKNPVFMVAYANSFAASNADTWASELGVLSKKKPVSILNFKPADKGISGAVSLLGTISAFGGSIFIALIFSVSLVLTNQYYSSIFPYFCVIALSGFLGSLVDSYLGALVQAKYKCVMCNKVTEKKIHHGKTAELIKGIKWFNNDMVNFSSGVLSSIIAILLVINL